MSDQTDNRSRLHSLFDLLPRSLQEHLATPVPRQLWHYTSMKSMQSILDSGEMYATDARFLNDRDELVHAAQFSDRLIRAQPHPPEVVEFVRQHVADWFSIFLSFAHAYRNYVTCFTSRRDDLSQWRAYSGGSAGASMAFDLRSFRNLAPCVYRDERKKRLLEDTFAEMFTVGNMHFMADPALLLPPGANLPPEIEAKFPGAENNVKRASISLLTPIEKILPLFKHSSFEDEDEWRIVNLGSEWDPGAGGNSSPNVADGPNPNSIFYRARMDTLVPTIKINMKDADSRAPLTGLILGPGSHPNASDAVTRYLMSKGFFLDAEPSTVPYRATT